MLIVFIVLVTTEAQTTLYPPAPPAQSLVQLMPTSASMSSNYLHATEASKCIDGIYNNFCHTGQEVTSPWLAWLTVVLGNVAKHVGFVQIYNRNTGCEGNPSGYDGCEDRLGAYEIWVGDADPPTFSAPAVRCAAATAPPEYGPFMVPCNAWGAIVTVRKRATGILNLAEVNVYETPAPPPMLPPATPPPEHPSSPAPPSCSSPTGHTYAYPCCADPSRSYAGMWVNARWVGEVWFEYHCSCIIPQGTLIPIGTASVDYCAYSIAEQGMVPHPAAAPPETLTEVRNADGGSGPCRDESGQEPSFCWGYASNLQMCQSSCLAVPECAAISYHSSLTYCLYYILPAAEAHCSNFPGGPTYFQKSGRTPTTANNDRSDDWRWQCWLRG